MPARLVTCAAVLDRRAVLVALGAAVAGCAGRSPSSGPGSVPPPVPFQVHDAMPAFFSFWSTAEGRSIDEQIVRFRAEVMAVYPAVYAHHVLGLRSADPTRELDQRLAAWLPKLPAIVPRMRAIHERFHADVARGSERFLGSFPDFAWSGECWFFASVDGMNGGLRKVSDRLALLFGLDVIARDIGAMPAPVLFAHELFHVHQSQVLPSFNDEQTIRDALWSEGLATHVSTVIVPGTTDRQALPFSHLHDPAHPALDIPERRVFLDDAMPRFAPTLGPELRAALEAKDDTVYARFFLGRATAGLAERPVRSGYWFGLQVARMVARGRDLGALARVPPAALHHEIAAALDAVISKYPA